MLSEKDKKIRLIKLRTNVWKTNQSSPEYWNKLVYNYPIPLIKYAWVFPHYKLFIIHQTIFKLKIRFETFHSIFLEQKKLYIMIILFHNWTIKTKLLFIILTVGNNKANSFIFNYYKKRIHQNQILKEYLPYIQKLFLIFGYWQYSIYPRINGMPIWNVSLHSVLFLLILHVPWIDNIASKTQSKKKKKINNIYNIFNFESTFKYYLLVGLLLEIDLDWLSNVDKEDLCNHMSIQ